jgi:protocatechuate 3,4-dioxygenase beta subunit
MKWLFASLSVLALVGCSASANGPNLKPACSNNSQCSQGEVCLESGCAVPDQNLVVVVQPPDTSNLTNQYFPGVQSGDGGLNLDLQLTAASGFNVSSNLDSQPVTLSLTGANTNLPDLPFTLSVPQVIKGDSFNAPLGHYEVLANVVSNPINPSHVPPLDVSADLVGAGALGLLTLNFFDDSQLVHLHGQVLTKELIQDNAQMDGGPVVFSITASHDDATQTPASQPAQASQDTNYTYDLWVAPQDVRQNLVITVTATRGIAPQVNFTEPLSAFADPDGGANLPLDPTDDQLTIWTVQGRVLDNNRNPVSGAVVTMKGDLVGDSHYTSTPVTTDATGTYVATVVHGIHHTENYTVIAIPPATSGFAPQQSSLPVLVGAQATTVDAGGGVAETVADDLVLSPLTVTTGRVFDPSGSPIMGATVQVTPDPNANTGTSLPLSNATATTDLQGSFSVQLAPGQYRFTFSSPSAAQLLPLISRLFPVSGVNTQVPDTQFSEPLVVNGSVRGPDGTALAGSLVKAYHAGRVGADGQVSQPSVLLATGRVVSGGTFNLVLPRR